MVIKIRNINICKFRGIVNSDILLDSKSLLLKGDNGTGKSSIVEALEYFFTDDIRHITEVGGMSIKQHAPHVNFTTDDINIEIEFNNGITLSKSYRENPKLPSEMENYFNTAKEQKFILKN